MGKHVLLLDGEGSGYFCAESQEPPPEDSYGPDSFHRVSGTRPPTAGKEPISLPPISDPAKQMSDAVNELPGNAKSPPSIRFAPTKVPKPHAFHPFPRQHVQSYWNKLHGNSRS